MTQHLTASQVLETDLRYVSRQLADEWPALEGRRIFLSGGAGFLGYYLTHAVQHWNHSHPDSRAVQVTVCDNYARGIPPWVAQLAKDPAVRLLQHDITRPLPADVGYFDYVIHAASIASPTYYRKHPIETMDANVNGLRLLLERCRKQIEAGDPISGFLFFSTSEIYGDPPPDQIPTSETFRGYVSCTGPRACYDESKRYGETLCVNFAQQYGLPITMARPFNNYGPGLKITDRRVIPDLARDIFAGKDLVLLSDGSPTRTFCYIADAVVGYYKVLVRGRAAEAYNIGNETPEISMAALAELMAALAREQFGYSGKVVLRPSAEKDYLTDNPQRRCPSIAKARKDLGFEPKIPLEQGLAQTLAWYGENRVAEEA